jgi:hypothetical protein
MARKTATVVIPAADTSNRDAGKSYLITEMSATQAEKWAMRALSALLRSGVYVPDDVVKRGLAGIALVGIKGLMGLSFADAEPLMDEMFGCIQRVEAAVTRPLVEDDIEEVTTRLRLRSEAFQLHTGFSPAAFLSRQWEASRTTAGDTSNTPTSPDTSAP